MTILQKKKSEQEAKCICNKPWLFLGQENIFSNRATYRCGLCSGKITKAKYLTLIIKYALQELLEEKEK